MRSRSSSSGFTLLETLVALVILAAGLAGLLELLTGSLRLSEGARDVTAASVYASQRIEEALLVPVPVMGEEAGTFGEKYRWVTRISLLPGDGNDPYQAIRVEVAIRWNDGARERVVDLAATRWDRKRTEAGG